MTLPIFTKAQENDLDNGKRVTLPDGTAWMRYQILGKEGVNTCELVADKCFRNSLSFPVTDATIRINKIIRR